MSSPAEEQKTTAARRKFSAIWMARIACLLSVLGILLSLNLWQQRKELDHDEFERTHAAWLMHQGKVPFKDFFDHKPPYYWWFIEIYFKQHGANTGVFLWGRRWMLYTYAGSILLLYVLGRMLAGEATGLAAATIFASSKLVHYPATMMRGDGWNLLLFLLGAIIFIFSWRKQFRWYEGLSSGALLGLSFGILPKTGPLILGLALATAYECQFITGWKKCWTKRKIALCLFLVAFAGPIILPFCLYGLRYYHDVYVVATHLEPTFSPWGLFKNLIVGSYLVIPFSLLGLVVTAAKLAGKEERWPYLVILLFALMSMFTSILNSRPFVQAFYVFGPFLALLCGSGVGWVASHFSEWQKGTGIGLLCVGGLLVNLHPPYWDYPNNLERQISYINQLCRLIPAQETYAGNMESHPIFRHDGTFYVWNINLKTLQALDPHFKHDFVAELDSTKPYVVHNNILTRMAHDPSQVPRMKAFLEQNYVMIPNSELWLRKDAMPTQR